MYADDMLIISSDKDVKMMSNNLQKSLDSIVRWCNHNKLTVNNDKTKYMIFSNKKDTDCSLKTEDRPLCKVKHYEYMGVIIM